MPIMLDQGTEAHVVNTASLAGLIAADSGPYAVTKFGVVALSEAMHTELQRGGLKPRVSVLCPGYVNTNILDSNRNRPAELPDTAPQREEPMAEVFLEWFTEQLKKGLSPRNVGDQVLSAIREERFYILTHPDWNHLIEQRMRNILEGRNPTPMVPPGVESLMARLKAFGESQG